MPFNHYAKLKRILKDYPDTWFIRRINQPTQAKNFKGETVHFDYYYRLYDEADQPIKYGKFQQLDLLAKALGVPTESLPVFNDTDDSTIQPAAHTR